MSKPTDEEDETLTKIYVDLPNHELVGGESLWAAPLGGKNSYEIRNSPFHAYGLNFLDVVEAVAEAPDEKPRVRRLISASGHRTLRVCFDESSPLAERVPLLATLRGHRASIEGASQSYYAIDVEPDGNYNGVRAQLDAWEEQGILTYETCEARIPGSFDDRPPRS